MTLRGCSCEQVWVPQPTGYRPAASKPCVRMFPAQSNHTPDFASEPQPPPSRDTGCVGVAIRSGETSTQDDQSQKSPTLRYLHAIIAIFRRSIEHGRRPGGGSGDWSRERGRDSETINGDCSASTTEIQAVFDSLQKVSSNLSQDLCPSPRQAFVETSIRCSELPVGRHAIFQLPVSDTFSRAIMPNS